MAAIFRPACAIFEGAWLFFAEMKRKARKQFGALPFRMGSAEPEVMLITSRETKQWIIPKGWPKRGVAPRRVAAREAFEEAGLRGKVAKRPLGAYRYEKRMSPALVVPCEVTVFLLHVKRQLDDWPEKNERERCWLSPDEAAARVTEEELSALLVGLGQRLRDRPAGET
jgi:8-oxo-dGTP pyrophosphatase MutT (NUDIX family)